MIPQPNRAAGPSQAKRFHAYCDWCQHILVIVDGKFPKHDYAPGGPACPHSEKPHDTAHR